MNHLKLSLFGRFKACLNDHLIEGFRYKKTIALLAFLVAEVDQKHSREKLASFLWPDAPFKNARSNLRFTLADLRKNLKDQRVNPPFILITQDDLQFNLISDSEIDIIEFEKVVTQNTSILSELIGAIDLYKGSFLDGTNVPDNGPFEGWLALKRDDYHRQYMEVMSRVIGTLEQQQKYEEALEYAYRQLRVEPWLEEGHQHVMRLLATIGKRSAALAQYEKCTRALADGLGVKPGEETWKLYEAIRDGSFIPNRQSTLVSTSRSQEESRHQRDFNQPDDSSVFLLESNKKTISSPPFVARTKELNRLKFLLTQALNGEGQVCFIKGEPGQGKTALVDEFIRRNLPINPQLIAAKGKCQAYFGHGNYFLPFQEILGLICGEVHDQWDAGSISGEYARRLWELAPITVRCLLEKAPALVETLIRSEILINVTQRMKTDSETNYERYNELLGIIQLQKTTDSFALQRSPFDFGALVSQFSTFLCELSRHAPIILFLDDFQWADTDSLDLLFHLGMHIASARVLVVCACRTMDTISNLNDNLHLLTKIENEFKLHYGFLTINLDECEDRQLVDDYLNLEPNKFDDIFRDKLFEYTHGNPLFIIELLQWLEDCQYIVRGKEKTWLVTSSITWDFLPTKIEVVIAERFKRLSAKAIEILQYACIEGERFTVEVISRIGNMEINELFFLLNDELEKKYPIIRADRFIFVEGQRLSVYRFQHILYQVFIYQTLDPVLQAHLHEQVGMCLEQLYGENKDEIANQLARHYEQSGHLVKAIEFHHRAGKRAARLFIFDEAIYHLCQALALLSENELNWRYNLLLDLEKVHHLSGQREAQREDIHNLEKLVHHFGAQQHAEVALCWCRYDNCCWYFQELYEVSRVVIDHAQNAGNIALEAEGSMYFALANEALSIFDEAERMINHALELSQITGFEKLQAMILREVARFYLDIKSDPVLAFQYVNEAMGIFRKNNDLIGIQMSLSLLGVCLIAQGDYVGALRHLEDCHKFSRSIGDWFDQIWALYYMAIFYWFVGKPEYIEAEVLESIKITRELKNEYLESLLLVFLSLAKWLQEDYPEALIFSNSAYEAAKRGVQAGKFGRIQEGIARCIQGFVNIELGDLELAAFCFKHGSQLIFEDGKLFYTHMPLVSLAHIELLIDKTGSRSQNSSANERALSYVEEALIVLEQRPITALDPMYLRSFLIAYKVLAVNRDSRAPAMLERAYSLLLEEKNKISDDSYRASFMERIPWNCEIVELWQTGQDDKRVMVDTLVY